MDTEDREPLTPQAKRFNVSLYLLTGTIAILAALWAEFDRDEFIKSAQSATGTVYKIEIVERHRGSYEHSINHFPWVSFVDAKNREFRFRGKEGPSKPAYKINDQVPVLYDPQNPAMAYIKTSSELNLLKRFLYFLALLFLILALNELFRRTKAAKRRPFFPTLRRARDKTPAD